MTGPESAKKFAARVDDSGGPDSCHPWKGAKAASGYGHFYVKDRKVVCAHRWQMEQQLGRPLADGEVVMHSCDNPPCVNPAHLSVGTHADNMKDMAVKGRGAGWKAANTHCPHGHPYTGENLRIRPDGARRCRACARAAAERMRRARGAPLKSPPCCPKGHEFTPENTRIKNGARACRECGRNYDRARRKKAANG